MTDNPQKCDYCENDALIVIDNHRFECGQCHLKKTDSKGKKVETYTSRSRTFGFSKTSSRSFAR